MGTTPPPPPPPTAVSSPVLESGGDDNNTVPATAPPRLTPAQELLLRHERAMERAKEEEKAFTVRPLSIRRRNERERSSSGLGITTIGMFMRPGVPTDAPQVPEHGSPVTGTNEPDIEEKFTHDAATANEPDIEEEITHSEATDNNSDDECPTLRPSPAATINPAAPIDPATTIDPDANAKPNVTSQAADTAAHQESQQQIGDDELERALAQLPPAVLARLLVEEIKFRRTIRTVLEFAVDSGRDKDAHVARVLNIVNPATTSTVASGTQGTSFAAQGDKVEITDAALFSAPEDDKKKAPAREVKGYYTTSEDEMEEKATKRQQKASARKAAKVLDF